MDGALTVLPQDQWVWSDAKPEKTLTLSGEIDWKAGVVVWRYPSGKEFGRTELPEQYIELWRRIQRVKIIQEIERRCAGVRRRQQRVRR